VSGGTGRSLVVLAVPVMVLALLGVGCTSSGAERARRRPSLVPTTTSSRTTTTATPNRADDAAADGAAALLATLPVKGRAPKTGYSRDQFGPAWADVDRNGCDTRNDILARDLTSVSWRPGTHDCVVVAGVLADPYTGRTIAFEKARAGEVQIDHVVALGDAWQTGAQALAPARRAQLANDPLELLAVDGSSNESKSDADAASWLPPNKAFRCRYVARQVAVKAEYGLWVTPAEHDAIARVLRTCSGEPTPRPSSPTTSYRNCEAARAAGVAPLRRGQPGYAPRLDRDGDGMACD
jgi:hypothetical protein